MTNEEREIATTLYHGITAIGKNIIHFLFGNQTKKDKMEYRAYKREATNLKRAQDREYAVTRKEFDDKVADKQHYAHELKEALDDHNVTRARAIRDSYKEKSGNK